MQHIITDEEVNNAVRIYTSAPGIMGAMKEALLDFLANRPEPTLGKLRPIAEMSETVPDGCLKVYAVCHGKTWLVEKDYGFDPTHFAFIQLPTPDPEAEERLRFEEAMKVGGYSAEDLRKNQSGDCYIDAKTDSMFQGWKLAKAK